MKYLYDFGISQDDPNVEGSVLPLDKSNLLSIASGGEMPLSLLAKFDTRITAVDISLNQIRLCKLKLAATLVLEPLEAAIFLGFKNDVGGNWNKYYNKVRSTLPKEESDFWDTYKAKIQRGPVRYSRFEKYLSFFCKIVSPVLGRKNLMKLYEMESPAEQRIYFDRYLDKKIIFWIFRIAFSPSLYKNRGLSQNALIHQKGNDMALMFYRRFRDFFTATPARNNYYLQFYFMGEVVNDRAMPDFLKPAGMENIRKRQNNLSLEVKSIQQLVSEGDGLHYKNYALSNISDWMPEAAMNDLLTRIKHQSTVKFNMLLRYIHKNPLNGKIRVQGYHFETLLNEEVNNLDRFPFYSYVKAKNI